jgi:hypothetical protein
MQHVPPGRPARFRPTWRQSLGRGLGGASLGRRSGADIDAHGIRTVSGFAHGRQRFDLKVHALAQLWRSHHVGGVPG